MRNITLEQELLAVRSKQSENKTFVHNTMRAIREQAAAGTFEQVLRTTNATKKERFVMKLKHLPKTVLAIGGIVLIGGTAYAAANWFGTTANLESKNNIVKVSLKDCPVPFQRAIMQGYASSVYSLTETYQIVNPKVATPQDLEDAHLVECEQNALDAIAGKELPDVFFQGVQYQGKAPLAKNGMYTGMSAYGTVTALSPTSITIADVPVMQEGKDFSRDTFTMALPDTVKVLDKGQPALMNNLAVGDQVYFVYQNSAELLQPGEDEFTPHNDSVLRFIAKTQYDYRPYANLFQSLQGEKSFKTLNRSTDMFAG